MERNIYYLLTVVFLISLLGSCSQKTKQKISPIIPQLTSLTFEDGSFSLSDKVTIHTNLKDKAKVHQWIGSLPVNKTDILDNLHEKNIIKIVLDSIAFENTSSEAYEISITKESIIIRGASEVALYYGIQSIHQLYNEFGNKIPAITIKDSPRFSVRSLMLDASSQFLSPDFIKKQIDIMARYKMNRLQWLLAGEGGWRFSVSEYPSLSEKTAWRTDKDFHTWINSGSYYCTKETSGAYGGYYTRNEIRDIVNYAADRFITIVPAIDLPCAHHQLAKSAGLNCEDKNETTFIVDVLSELTDLFPSEHIYIGNGQADDSFGTVCKSCRSRIDKERTADESEPHAHTLREAEKFLTDKGRKLIAWEESLRTGLSSETTIIAWHNVEEGLTAAAKGYDVIMAPADFSSLSYYQTDPTNSTESMSGFLPLEEVYAFNPIPTDIPAEQASYIKGFQVNMWTHFTNDDESIEQMLYPRLFAAAEAGWTVPSRKSYLDFRKRAEKAIYTIKNKSYNSFDITTELTIRPESVNQFHSLARNKEVKYHTMFHESFPANGIISLTDGIRGGWYYGDGGWQGFIGKAMSVTIDLGKGTPVQYISATFISDITAKVYLPKEVHIYISDDGEEFKEITNIINKQSTEIKGYRLEDFNWRGNINTRYLRYEAISVDEPGVWLFTDEIIVQ